MNKDTVFLVGGPCDGTLISLSAPNAQYVHCFSFDFQQTIESNETGEEIK